MDIVLFAGKIEQWRLPGDPARSSDINAPGNDLSRGRYFVETNKSPPINLLFTALFDLIICHTTKMGLLIPCKFTTSMPYSPRRLPRSWTASERNGLLAPWEVPMESISQYSGFMMMMLNHHKREIGAGCVGI